MVVKNNELREYLFKYLYLPAIESIYKKDVIGLRLIDQLITCLIMEPYRNLNQLKTNFKK